MTKYRAARGRIVYRPNQTLERGSSSSPRVVTLVESALEAPIASATSTCCTIVHTRSVPEAIFATRDRSVHVLLLSPNAIVSERAPAIARLVTDCPGLVTLAVIGDRHAQANQRLLDLGAVGVRRVVDLTSASGWRELRSLVTETSESAGPLLLEPILRVLADSSSECRWFMEVLIRRAPHVTTVGQLARELEVRPSTLMSRFYRHRLPAPKRYLAATRLLYAYAYFETSRSSLANVCHRLDYSSPQSFSRHVKMMMGMTPGHFRYRFSLSRMIGHYVDTLLLPHRETFRFFNPFGGAPHHSASTVAVESQSQGLREQDGS